MNPSAPLPPMPPPGRRPTRGRRGPGTPPSKRGMLVRVALALLFLLAVLGLRHVLSGGGQGFFDLWTRH